MGDKFVALLTVKLNNALFEVEVLRIVPVKLLAVEASTSYPVVVCAAAPQLSVMLDTYTALIVGAPGAPPAKVRVALRTV